LVCAACGPDARDEDLGEPGGSGSGSGSGSGGNGGGSGSGDGTIVYVYAHSSSALYKVDPDTLAITKIGDFGWGSVGSDVMTDIAIDKNGVMIGVSYDRVYKVDTNNAQTTMLSGNLGGTFNGLSFVPATQIGGVNTSTDDVLVGTRNSDGKVFRIDPMTGAATQTGDKGSYVSCGDLVAVDGFGTMQTLSNGFGSGGDSLARLAQTSFSAAPVGGGTGFQSIWGVAFWKNKVYGFTNYGEFLIIDPMTGAAMLVEQTDVNWWGAAVTTIAPVVY
jgi:hypothetical protein